MGFDNKSVRDGTGPFKDSFRRTVEEKDIGRRKEAGEECPFEVLDSKKLEKLEEGFRL